MLRRFSANAAVFTMLVDVVLVAIGMKLASLLLPGHAPFQLLAYLIFPLVWWLVFLIGGLYDGTRNTRIVDELSAYFSLSLLAATLLAGLLYLHASPTPVSLFLACLGNTIALQILARGLMRLYWRIKTIRQNGNGARRILIIGAGKIGRKVKEEIQQHEGQTPNRVVGFVDDAPHKRSRPEVLGSIAETIDLLQKQKISDVIITLPASAHHLRQELVRTLQTQPVRIWVIPDMFRLALYQPKIETFAGMPMLDVRAARLNEQERLAKRIFDLLATILLLLICWPVMLVIAILIRRDSPGPAIFRQTRIGENGVPFEMYKFRTMINGAEKLGHLVETQNENGDLIHKTPTDPRVTRLGHFLRRSSLDELPQFWNVLRGEMSLVGPRPELPHIVAGYQPWQHARHSVPPGITGWWQINGRSDKPMHLHTEDDIYYIQNCSLWLDIQILLKTVLVVVLKKGAY